MSGQEDYLTEDNEIPGQKYCLLSFLSPENVLAKKELFFFEHFMRNAELSFKSKHLETFLANTVKKINDSLEASATVFEAQDLSGTALKCRSSQIKLNEVLSELNEFVKTNRSEFNQDNAKEMYDDFLFSNSTKLEDEFYKLNDFRTTVRGLKIRGTYSSHEEAVSRSKKLQSNDKIHNIFVGEVGKWLPWDPEPSKVKEQEYAQPELNNLMKKYSENEEARESHHRERKDRMKSQQHQSNTISDNHNELFSDSADLAIQRKMEKNNNS